MECMPVINQKGGVGKTATSVNLGAALAQRGKRMLLIDLDPQGHLTTHLGLDGEAKGAGIYEVLTKGLPLEAAIHPYSPMISVVPAQIDLAAAEAELIATVGREVILRDVLSSQDWPYDIAIVDCPPSLGVLTLNALSAATQVLIPLQPHFLALQGVGKLFETIALVAQRINPRLRVAGMVMCLYEPATRLGGEVIADLAAFLEAARNTPVPWRDARLMETRIRRNIKLAECPSYGQSIFEYEPRSHGALDYLALADELLAIWAPRAAATAPIESIPAAPIAVAVPALPVPAATNNNADPPSRPTTTTADANVVASIATKPARTAAAPGAKPANASVAAAVRPAARRPVPVPRAIDTTVEVPPEKAPATPIVAKRSAEITPRSRTPAAVQAVRHSESSVNAAAPAALKPRRPAATPPVKRSSVPTTEKRTRPPSKPTDLGLSPASDAPAPVQSRRAPNSARGTPDFSPDGPLPTPPAQVQNTPAPTENHPEAPSLVVAKNAPGTPAT